MSTADNVSTADNIEIERRFRVDVERLAPDGSDGKPLPDNALSITQGYLSVDPHIRVRISYYRNTRGCVEECSVTIKGDGTVARTEYVLPLPDKHAGGLLAMCRGRVIHKIRHRLHIGGRRWFVDQFEHPHAGLWLAETELHSADESFPKPPWLGREVTEDKRYSNVQLASNALDEFWRDDIGS